MDDVHVVISLKGAAVDCCRQDAVQRNRTSTFFATPGLHVANLAHLEGSGIRYPGYRIPPDYRLPC